MALAGPVWGQGSGYMPPFGKLVTSGTAPGVSACGTSPAIAGNDFMGKVTVGTTPGVTCLVTFANTWANAPACITIKETTTLLVSATSTTTTLTLGGVFLGGDVLAYVCVGR